MTDLVDLSLYGQLVDGSEGEAKKQTDASLQGNEGITVCTLDFFFRPAKCSRVGNSPVGCLRLTRPEGANFFGSIVTDRKDEIEFGSIGHRELVPTLASETLRGQVSTLQLRDSLRSNYSRGMAPSAVSSEVRSALVIHNGLGHD